MKMKYMSRKEWYSSKEHFNTEMSYDEYIKKMIKKMKMKRKIKLDTPDGDLP